MLIFKIENDVNTLIKLFIDIFYYELSQCALEKLENIFIEMSWKFNKCLISFNKRRSWNFIERVSGWFYIYFYLKGYVIINLQITYTHFNLQLWQIYAKRSGLKKKFRAIENHFCIIYYESSFLQQYTYNDTKQNISTLFQMSLYTLSVIPVHLTLSSFVLAWEKLNLPMFMWILIKLFILGETLQIKIDCGNLSKHYTKTVEMRHNIDAVQNFNSSSCNMPHFYWHSSTLS